MPCIVVNPGSAAAWEVELKAGANSLGRGPANDVNLAQPSVSGAHCLILVKDGNAVIQDLGSTNGTFVERKPVKEAVLSQGQTIHVGSVEIRFHADGQTQPSTTLKEIPATVGSVPISQAPVPAAGPGSQSCKFHPRTPGRFYCAHCQRFYCEICVNSRQTDGVQKKFCRHCGAECQPVQIQVAGPAQDRGFFARLPGAFVYPFKGSGLLVLIFATLIFAGLDAAGGGFAILMIMAALGYLFSYMQNIIQCTAAGDDEVPSLPGMDGLFGSFFTLAGVVLISFTLPIGFAVAKYFSEVEVPLEVLMVTMVLGCLYFPMAFLSAAMKDTALAANPMIVIPAMVKVPLQYLVTAAVLTGVFGTRLLGNVMTSAAKAEGYATRDMSVLFATFGIRAGWSLLSVYLLTVGMRILGLLYLTNKEKFGWFRTR